MHGVDTLKQHYRLLLFIILIFALVVMGRSYAVDGTPPGLKLQ
jgi:hypothetical protein